MKELRKFLEWWALATAAERTKLALLMDTSVTYLRSHMATGRRIPSVEYAVKLEGALAKIRRRSASEPLPEVDRRDLCDTCKKCPFRV